jgi:hypothetical protein
MNGSDIGKQVKAELELKKKKEAATNKIPTPKRDDLARLQGAMDDSDIGKQVKAELELKK